MAGDHYKQFKQEAVSSGIAELDALMHGGLDRGTSTLIIGPAASGKSTVALQYAVAAATREERVSFYSFEEIFPPCCAYRRNRYRFPRGAWTVAISMSIASTPPKYRPVNFPKIFAAQSKRKACA